MTFTTIRLAHKKSEVEIESLEKYDLYEDIPIIAKKHNNFKVYKGSKYFDLIGLVDPWNIAISEKFKNLLEENNITGWKCYPIIIQETKLKYYIFEVIGKAGLISDLDEDGDRVYGTTEVEISTWDGSDIFHIGDTATRVCTLKVKEIIEKAKISNIEFWDLNRY